MKHYLSISLALVCIVLVIILVVMKQGDDAQQASDAGTITDYSNRLESAQMQVAAGEGTMIALTNSLDESRSASLAFSNQLAGAESTIALDTQQITNLNQQVASSASENQALNQRFMDLTNQMAAQIAGLTGQIASTQAGLDQANNDYALLENRLRIDVAERVVVERKFNNLLELQAQIQKLKENPADEISAESIYAGLDVEVKSNTVHVIAPN